MSTFGAFNDAVAAPLLEVLPEVEWPELLAPPDEVDEPAVPEELEDVGVGVVSSLEHAATRQTSTVAMAAFKIEPPEEGLSWARHDRQGLSMCNRGGHGAIVTRRITLRVASGESRSSS